MLIKGFAVKKLSSTYNISKENIIAIGDNLNDIPMLQEASFSIAMLNANDEVKIVARFTTKKTCEKEGVRKFLKKLVK